MLSLIDHMHDHLVEIVYHCCITMFPHRRAKIRTKTWGGKKEGVLFVQLVSTSMIDLKELGLMGELERTFCNSH